MIVVMLYHVMSKTTSILEGYFCSYGDSELIKSFRSDISKTAVLAVIVKFMNRRK